MNKLPLVSIIIPTFNRQSFIAETIDSSLGQDYGNIEIIITDNASSDDTVKIVKEYVKRDNRVKLICQKKNLGPVMNWKAGINFASGQYIKILWSDDLISRSFITKAMNLFNDYDNLAFVYSSVKVGERLDSAFEIIYDYFPYTGIFDVSEFVNGIYSLKPFPYSPGCAIFEAQILRESFMEANDLFHNNYLENGAGPDVLMFLMASLKSDHFGYINEPLSFFRSHDSSITISSKRISINKGYAKATIWFLWKYFGKEKAIIYWIHKFKKLKLFKKKNFSEVHDFKMLTGDTDYWLIKYPLLVLKVIFLPSTQYLKDFKHLKTPNSNERLKF